MCKYSMISAVFTHKYSVKLVPLKRIPYVQTWQMSKDLLTDLLGDQNGY